MTIYVVNRWIFVNWILDRIHDLFAFLHLGFAAAITAAGGNGACCGVETPEDTTLRFSNMDRDLVLFHR